MAYWIKVTGTGEHPFTDDDWRPRRDRWARERGGGSFFPRRPSIRRADRLVLYAAGSAAAFGAGRLFAVEEVLSDEPEPSGHPRWKWRVYTRELCSVALLSRGPTLAEIDVSARSLGRHSHIRLTDEQGRRAEELMRRYGEEAAKRP